MYFVFLNNIMWSASRNKFCCCSLVAVAVPYHLVADWLSTGISTNESPSRWFFVQEKKKKKEVKRISVMTRHEAKRYSRWSSFEIELALGLAGWLAGGRGGVLIAAGAETKMKRDTWSIPSYHPSSLSSSRIRRRRRGEGRRNESVKLNFIRGSFFNFSIC